jgi:formate hydrogenlyase subunit 3/multisubunit Na+/H+ antiporter MnhD subunit
MTTISKYTAQKKIALTWFIFSSLIVILFIFISSPRAGENVKDYYSWLIGFLSPALSLIVSSFIYSANNRETLEQKFIDSFFVRLVNIASVFYLLFLLGILLATPFSQKKDIKFIDYLNNFSLLLSFIQTLILALLGIFFVKNDSK